MTRPARPDGAVPGSADAIIRRLCRELGAARLRYANLLAATHAALSAARDGEPDALDYLADEVAVAHDRRNLDRGPHWWDEVDR